MNQGPGWVSEGPHPPDPVTQRLTGRLQSWPFLGTRSAFVGWWAVWAKAAHRSFTSSLGGVCVWGFVWGGGGQVCIVVRV